MDQDKLHELAAQWLNNNGKTGESMGLGKVAPRIITKDGELIIQYTRRKCVYNPKHKIKMPVFFGYRFIITKGSQDNLLNVAVVKYEDIDILDNRTLQGVTVEKLKAVELIEVLNIVDDGG